MARTIKLLVLVFFLAVVIGCRDASRARNEAPTAVVVASTDIAAAYEQVTFDARDSVDRDGSIESYTWDLGDGNTAEGATITHVYPAGGNSYVVTLTVSDDLGSTSSAQTTVEIIQCLPCGDP